MHRDWIVGGLLLGVAAVLAGAFLANPTETRRSRGWRG
jgi:hypothetical protein